MTAQKQHDIWKFFPFIDETQTTRQCSVCLKTYCEPLKQSTAKTHFFINHPEIWQRVKSRPKRKEKEIIYSDETTTTTNTIPPTIEGPSFSDLSKIGENQNMMVMDDPEQQSLFAKARVETVSSELIFEYNDIKINIKGGRSRINILH
ncbi:12596_t:CDS:1 [Cetraspora pellucida]|uniref:12596_t:CDS:1 n=1 Tax=Cetraspora pellucida TaxID=1433469 RepID=A0A9N9DRV5_9GLOM|nr:12596_t:CDS:1 [Cetraspora pellucida]